MTKIRALINQIIIKIKKIEKKKHQYRIIVEIKYEIDKSYNYENCISKISFQYNVDKFIQFITADLYF